MNPFLLTVYKSPFRKERLGRKWDGGYVTVALPYKYDLLLSAGISNDSSFEDDWMDRFGVKCIAFDGTIDRCPSEKISWIKKNVGTKNSESTDDLKDLLKAHRSVFLKMDIEGSETAWFESLDDELENVLQMVVEFHNAPYDQRHGAVYEKINRTHALLHLHGNNFSGTVNSLGFKMPVAPEMTFVNRKALPSTLEKNAEPIPGPHDRPNNKGSKDLDLNNPPFVFKS